MKTKKTPVVRFDESMKPMIKELLKTIGHDGHTIWDPSILKNFPEDIQNRFIRKHKSDGSYKGSIWNEGTMVKELQGIYGLQLLQTICNDLNLEYEGKIGRGFQAQVCTEAINNWLKN